GQRNRRSASLTPGSSTLGSSPQLGQAWGTFGGWPKGQPRHQRSQGGGARGGNPPGSPRTERDSPPSLRSCHLDHQGVPDPRPVGEVAGILPGDSLPGRPSFLLGP